MTETKSTCPYCGVGCGVIIESSGDQITGVRGDPLHPANFGRLCSKGSNLHLTATAAVTQQTRLLHPMQRANRGAFTEDHVLAGADIKAGNDKAIGFLVGQVMKKSAGKANPALAQKMIRDRLDRSS